MRLLSYNILDGGVGRVDALAAVIAAQRPDVVCLVEAADLPVVAELAGRLRMDYVQGLGRKHASAVLTRWTLRESVNHAALHADALSKSLLEATVAAPGGESWVIGVPHMIARATEERERVRERELDVVLGAFEPYRRRGTPHLLAGDFNANAPKQQIDPDRCHPDTRKEWAENGGHIPRRAVQKLLDAGYVDALRAVRGAEADRTATFTTDHPGQRVDYVFTCGIDPARLRDAWVVQSDEARRASDHFPVGVEIA